MLTYPWLFYIPSHIEFHHFLSEVMLIFSVSVKWVVGQLPPPPHTPKQTSLQRSKSRVPFVAAMENNETDEAVAEPMQVSSKGGPVFPYAV